VGGAAPHAGQGAEAVLSGLAHAAERAAAAGNGVAELALGLDRAAYEVVYEPTESAANRLRERAEKALPVLEEAGDEWALAIACGTLVLAAELRSRSWAEIAAAAERVVGHARRADYHPLIDWGEAFLVHAQYYGTTPVEESLRWLEEHHDVERRSVLPSRDRPLAMLGRFDEAHRLLTKAADRAAELGVTRFRIHLAMHRFDLAMLEGEPARAEMAAREAAQTAEAAGSLGNLLWYCCSLAGALLQLGRDAEAEQWLDHGHETAPSEERLPQMLWRQVRGKLLARRGEFHEAERLAREAVALGAETDMLNAHADALIDLADVLALAGRDAQAELEQALALYERKGNLVMATRTRSRLEELTPATLSEKP
jgi:tetratricopeptide (TPR) repeat protein